MKIKNKKIVKVGTAYYINIPKQYINDNYIDIDKTYNIDITEVINE